jgi:hypothetical protein
MSLIPSSGWPMATKDELTLILKSRRHQVACHATITHLLHLAALSLRRGLS